uniref:Uncharacterized protein n=1 Tax=Coccidioides posadasii RMSCC 3488 TaxID=454284 RepID=A0A0J6F2E6_COCPO|nr:hypothetical protein CPAG_03402 [Coccidioides posadasii RMSCC 3488]
MNKFVVFLLFPACSLHSMLLEAASDIRIRCQRISVDRDLNTFLSYYQGFDTFEYMCPMQLAALTELFMCHQASLRDPRLPERWGIVNDGLPFMGVLKSVFLIT